MNACRRLPEGSRPAGIRTTCAREASEEKERRDGKCHWGLRMRRLGRAAWGSRPKRALQIGKTRRKACSLRALPPFSLSLAKEKSRQSSLHHAILLKNILFIPTKIQYKNPNIQSGIFRSFPYSRLSAAIYASAAVLICARVLFFPPTSMVYCPSTRKSPVSEYSSSCP